MVEPQYGPAGKTRIAVVVLDENFRKKSDLVGDVRNQCREWFGDVVNEWDYKYPCQRGTEKQMTTSEQEVQEKIHALLSSQQLAVLSTQRDGQPYSSLMAFAFTADLKNIVIATGISTRKHQNIVQECRVSLLVDNRSNSDDDLSAAMALTVLGRAQSIEEAERNAYEKLYLNRHPTLENFLASPTTALLRVRVSHYLLVSRFQNVMEYHVEDQSDLFI